MIKNKERILINKFFILKSHFDLQNFENEIILKEI